MFREEDVIRAANLVNLTKKEQDLLIKSIRGSNVKRSLFAKNLLIIRCEPLIRAVSKKYIAYSVPLDELMKLGKKGLIKAIEKYDTAKRYRFTVYASWWIRAEIHRKLGLPTDVEGYGELRKKNKL